MLNVYRRFAIPAFTPVLLNVSIIGAAILLARYFDPPIKALAVGRRDRRRRAARAAAVGGARASRRCRAAAPRPADEGVRRVLRAMGPAVIGVSAAQISVLISTQLAALLGDGRISWITYADRLMEFPTALLGVALGTVILPFARAAPQRRESRRILRRCSTGACALRCCSRCRPRRAVAPRGAAVATLYQYGHFTVERRLDTRRALLGYAIGLPALILIKILAPGFYARQVMRTPVKIAFVTVVVTQVLAVLLAWPLGFGHAGLTLATSLGACFNAGLLFLCLAPARLLCAARRLARRSLLAHLRGTRRPRRRAARWLGGSPRDWLVASLWSRIGWLVGLAGRRRGSHLLRHAVPAGIAVARLRPQGGNRRG